MGAEHYIVVRAGGPPGRRIILYDYIASRTKAALKQLLIGADGTYSGKLISDGLGRYDEIAAELKLLHFGCLQHCRSMFFKALRVSKLTSSRTLENVAVETYIRRVYQDESEIGARQEQHQQRGEILPEEIVLQLREQKSKPVLEQFKAGVDELLPGTPRNSALGKALAYTTRQWSKLTRHLQHPEIPVDNNYIELKHYATVRKSWLFAYDAVAALASANLFAQVMTARANGVEPYAYFHYLFEYLPAASTVPPTHLAHDLTITPVREPSIRAWTVAQKARVLIEELALTVHLKRAGVAADQHWIRWPGRREANYLLRYLHRLFAWGRRHGHCQTNPDAGAKRTPVQPRSGMPTHVAYDAVLKFAPVRGVQPRHSTGSLAPYLGPLMEIKYLCRMRSIEVFGLTDAHASEQGIYIARHKGSEDNMVLWSPRLRAASEAAVAVHATIRAGSSNKARPLPPPERRFVFVTETATRLFRATLSPSWQQLMRAAVESRAITPEQRFTLHGLERRGVMDTKGSRRRKQGAASIRCSSSVLTDRNLAPGSTTPSRRHVPDDSS